MTLFNHKLVRKLNLLLVLIVWVILIGGVYYKNFYLIASLPILLMIEGGVFAFYTYKLSVYLMDRFPATYYKNHSLIRFNGKYIVYDLEPEVIKVLQDKSLDSLRKSQLYFKKLINLNLIALIVFLMIMIIMGYIDY